MVLIILFAVPTMTEGRSLALDSTRPPDSPTLLLPQELESWYLAKVFILLATAVTVVASVEMKARGATRGTWPQPREVTALFPKPWSAARAVPTPQGGPPKHWVRSEDSTADIPLSPSLPPSPDPASSGLGPGNWQHVEELESQERNWGLFSLQL